VNWILKIAVAFVLIHL